MFLIKGFAHFRACRGPRYLLGDILYCLCYLLYRHLSFQMVYTFALCSMVLLHLRKECPRDGVPGLRYGPHLHG